MTVETVLGFLTVALLAYGTPGPDWFVVLRHSAHRPRAGLVSALGVQTGLAVHMGVSALGVATLLLASTTAFTVVKVIGAAYLVFLGVQSLRTARRSAVHPGKPTGDGHPTSGHIRVYRQSLLANVLNPKAALFFAAVLPQFISTTAPVLPQVLLLGILDILLGILWWMLFVYGISRIQRLMERTRSRVLLDRISGVALITLGGALALADKPGIPIES